MRHIVDGSVYPQVGLVKFHICGVEASGVLSISPDVGHQCSAEQESAYEYEPGAGMACGCWSAWDWYRNQCPVGVAYTELAGPVGTRNKRFSRLRSG